MNTEEQIVSVTQELLSHMQIVADVQVEAQGSTDQESSYHVTIQTEESGLLIGRHGETLNSLQMIIGIMLFKKTGSWVHLMIDVGNYRKMREESVTSMADRIVSEVEQTGQAVSLPYLSSFERRLVHVRLQDHPTVVSESVGEGKDRRLMIRPKV